MQQFPSPAARSLQISRRAKMGSDVARALMPAAPRLVSALRNVGRRERPLEFLGPLNPGQAPVEGAKRNPSVP